MLIVTFDSTDQASHVARLIRTHGVESKITGRSLRIHEESIKTLEEAGHYDEDAILVDGIKYRVSRTSNGRPSLADGSHSVRIMLTVDPAILSILTETAKRAGITRSAAIREGITLWLGTTPWSDLIVNETAHAITDLQTKEGNYAVVLTLDSDGTPGTWLANLDDKETKAMPHVVVVSREDNLDSQLAAKIDYKSIIAQVRNQWMKYPTEKSLTIELVREGYDADVVAEAISTYEYSSCRIGNKKFLTPETVKNIRESLKI